MRHSEFLNCDPYDHGRPTPWGGKYLSSSADDRGRYPGGGDTQVQNGYPLPNGRAKW